MNEQPNVILICVDQWRGDALSIQGHPVVHTPALDGLALRGTRFTRAYASVPSCIAARASLLTGLSPRTHGRVGYRDRVPWNYATTIAGEFARHGYHTQAVGKMHVYPQRSLMGFHNVVLHDGYLHVGRKRTQDLEQTDDYLPWLRQHAGHDVDYIDHGVECNSYDTRPWDKPEFLHPTNFITTQSIDFLRRRDPRKPFFLFMSYHRPHPPLDPPAWAFERYNNEPMPASPVGDWVDYFQPIHSPHRINLSAGVLPEPILRRAKAGYFGHLTHIDQQINRFLEILLEYELTKNTVIAFVSDHGDHLGDHHLFRKSLPYEGSAHVPFILAGVPGIKDSNVCDAPVELRDIMPTLLDCAGLPVPESIEGQSALPLARGQQPASVGWRNYLHGEHTWQGIAPGSPIQSVQYLTDGKEKYIWFSGDGHEQLFDLAQDPQECHDLAPLPAHRDRLQSWRQRLIGELKDREEGFTDGAKLIPGRTVKPVLAHLLQAGA